MRRIAVLVPIALAACATAEPQPAVVGQASNTVCRGLAAGQFVGREASSELGPELLRASGARIVRWVRPGMKVTMDYREDRLTVHLDERNRIARAGCG